MFTEEKLIEVEDQWLKEQSLMLEAWERDEEETEITLCFLCFLKRLRLRNC